MSEPWVCPKCGRVYSYMIFECNACNSRIQKQEETTTRITDALLIEGAQKIAELQQKLASRNA